MSRWSTCSAVKDRSGPRYWVLSSSVTRNQMREVRGGLRKLRTCHHTPHVDTLGVRSRPVSSSDDRRESA
jgi:hypothetical protein